MALSHSELPKREQTRQKLIDSAMQHLLVVGPDQLGFTAISKSVGLSTGSLYSRYENVDELLIDVWQLRCIPALRSLQVDICDSVTKNTRPDAIVRLASAVNSKAPSLTAAVVLMLVARRNITLGEVVFPQVREHMRIGLAAMPEYNHVLSHICGQLLISHGARLENVDWSGVIRVVTQSAMSAEPNTVVMEKVRPRQSLFSFSAVDQFDHDLFSALALIISEVGVDRATVSRIGRRANVNPASIYARYASKNELIARSVLKGWDTTSTGDDEFVGRVSKGESILDDSVALFRACLSSDFVVTRRLRLELLLASSHNDLIYETLRAKHVELMTNASLQHGVAIDGPVRRGFFHFSRAMFFGHFLIHEFDGLFADDALIYDINRGILEGIFRLQNS